jgi:hypothetical protein
MALGEDERKIVGVVLERLERGRKEYGEWEVSDGRDYRREALEEIVDALHYCTAALVRIEKDE